MAKRVVQRQRRRKARAARVTRQQQADRQRLVQDRLKSALAAVVKEVVEQALEEEVTALLGRDAYARSAPPRRAGAGCNKCHQDWAPNFRRAGSYQRTLLTVVAAVLIRVPRVSCTCGGSVAVPFATLGRYERAWGDVQERARQLSGLCLSLTDVREVLALTSGQPVARSTLNSWIHQAAALADALRQGPLRRLPAVVQLDGIWVKLLAATGEWTTDASGRRRQQRRRVKVPLLVAYGVDPVSGERWLLDWEQGEQEDQASWQRLLERLYARGLRADTGLELFISDGSAGLEAALDAVYFGPGVLHQRCVFHVLKNVRDKVHGEPGMSRADKRARRRAVLQAAQPIWQTTEAATARRRWRVFQAAWAAREPDAVATLAGVLGRTLRYLEAVARGRERGEEWRLSCVRTTSALERVNRALRQKARQVGVFGSEQGVTAAVALVVAHRGLCLNAVRGETWTDLVETVLRAA